MSLSTTQGKQWWTEAYLSRGNEKIPGNRKLTGNGKIMGNENQAGLRMRESRVFHYGMCIFLRNCDYLLSVGSALLTLSITIERFVAITNPFFFNMKHVKRFVIIKYFKIKNKGMPSIKNGNRWTPQPRYEAALHDAVQHLQE